MIHLTLTIAVTKMVSDEQYGDDMTLITQSLATLHKDFAELREDFDNMKGGVTTEHMRNISGRIYKLEQFGPTSPTTKDRY